MEYLLSRECGEIRSSMRQDPVNKGVKPRPGAKPLDQIKTVRPTYDEIRKGVPEVMEQFRDTFGV